MIFIGRLKKEWDRSLQGTGWLETQNRNMININRETKERIGIDHYSGWLETQNRNIIDVSMVEWLENEKKYHRLDVIDLNSSWLETQYRNRYIIWKLKNKMGQVFKILTRVRDRKDKKKNMMDIYLEWRKLEFV